MARAATRVATSAATAAAAGAAAATVEVATATVQAAAEAAAPPSPDLTRTGSALTASRSRPTLDEGVPGSTAVPGPGQPDSAQGTSAVDDALANMVRVERAESPPALPTTPAAHVQDVALGVASLIAEGVWRAGASGLALATRGLSTMVGVVRAVSPQIANDEATARINALAERGRRVRQERSDAFAEAVTGAVTTAVTSDAMREMTVAAIEEASDDVLAVVLPSVLKAVSEMETQAKLDELMAGLLLRQLPDALEKTLPAVLVRSATRPALGLVPFLGGSPRA